MFKNKILKPNFWDKSGLNFFSIILLPLTSITIFINFIKRFKIKTKFNIKTICVGNIYLGGTGKTQLVLKINEIIKNKYKTFVLKKNYHDQIDEQDLLKNKTNLILPKKRIEGLRRLNKLKKSVVIFDDGLQDKSINYDLSIVCFDSLNGIGNGKLLPAGPLREKLSELKNYDGVFINGEKNSSLYRKIKVNNKKIKIFSGKYILKNNKTFNLKLKYLAFCGIGNPVNFFKLLKQNKIKVEKKIIFPDHYNYKLSDINNIKKFAIKNNLKIVTTEKDFMKIKKFNNFNVKVTHVDFQLEKLKDFKDFLYDHL